MILALLGLHPFSLLNVVFCFVNFLANLYLDKAYLILELMFPSLLVFLFSVIDNVMFKMTNLFIIEH